MSREDGPPLLIGVRSALQEVHEQVQLGGQRFPLVADDRDVDDGLLAVARPLSSANALSTWR